MGAGRRLLRLGPRFAHDGRPRGVLVDGYWRPWRGEGPEPAVRLVAEAVRDNAAAHEEGEDVMGDLDAAARAAGYEVVAEVRMTHRDKALIRLPGEAEDVRVAAAEVAAGLGVGVGDLPGRRVRVTVRESLEAGRVLSGFRAAE